MPVDIIQRKEKQRQRVYASNETVLTRSGGACLCCYPHLEPRRRRSSEQGCVKPLVKLVWLWEVSTVLRSKDTSRVFCPSAPGAGRRRRLLVWWCGVKSCSWGKAGWSCSWEATLKGFLLLAPGACAWAPCHCPGGKGPAVQWGQWSAPHLQTSRLMIFGEQDLLTVLSKTRMPPPGKMVPEEQQGCLPSIPFSCFCHGNADVGRTELHARTKGSLYTGNWIKIILH